MRLILAQINCNALPVSRFHRTSFWLILLASLICSVSTVAACPNCPQGLRSLTEHVATADYVVVAELLSGATDEQAATGRTRLRILKIVKSPAKTKMITGSIVTLEGELSGKRGETRLLFGTTEEPGDKLVWNDSIVVTETSLQYVLKAPPLEVQPGKRLAYFLEYLESTDEFVANDAFAEFANAEYREIVSLAPHFPREKLRKWISSSETSVIRLGLYATMLGLCGNQDDAKLLENKILTQQAVGTFRLGLEGMISGYLMIQGEAGLKVIDQELLQNTSAEFSETYAAAQGLRFMWSYSNQISRERLCQSMEGLLNRPEMADLVIADLARWKDWSVQERLVKLYGQKDYNTTSIKRAIIRFLITCSNQTVTQGPGSDKIELQVKSARKSLEVLRKRDPGLVTDAERFFVVP